MTRSARNAITIALAGLFLCLLSACVCGNGEGYGGRHCGMGAANPNPPSYGSPSNTSTPTDYYWRDLQYQCTPAGSSVPIPSYRNLLEVSNGKASLKGDLCGNGIVADIDPSLLEISPLQPFVGYQEGIYEKLETAPAFGQSGDKETQSWCQATASRREFFVTLPYGGAVLEGLLMSLPSLTPPDGNYLSLNKTSDSSTLTYQAGFGTLVIQIAPSALSSFKHDATLTTTDGVMPMSCRVLRIP